MKIRNIALFTGICLHISLLYAALPFAKINSELDIKYASAFTNPQPLLPNFVRNDLLQWNIVVDELEAFIKENTTLDKDLTNGIVSLKKLNQTVLTVIEEMNKFISTRKDDFSIRQLSAQHLTRAINDLVVLIQKLEKKKPILTGNKEGTKLLIKFANHIKNAAIIARSELSASPDEIKKTIADAYDRTFNVPNLISKPLNKTNLNAWEKAVNNALQYATDNMVSFAVGTKEGSMTQSLINAIKHIKTQNNNVLTKIELARQQLAKTSSQDVALRNAQNLEEIIYRLNPILEYLKNNLTLLPTSNNQKVAEVLIYLISTIIRLAETAEMHIDKNSAALI